MSSISCTSKQFERSNGQRSKDPLMGVPTGENFDRKSAGRFTPKPPRRTYTKLTFLQEALEMLA